MAEKPIEASRRDFCQLAAQHANYLAIFEPIGLSEIIKGSQALVYISEERARDFLQTVRATLKPWENAKVLLEELVTGLSASSPRMNPALFHLEQKDLPRLITSSLIGLAQIGSAVYTNLNVPFTQSEEFRQLQARASNLLQTHSLQFTAYHHALESIKGLVPEANIKSAVDVIMSEGREIINQAEYRRRFTFVTAMPVNALLYLLQVAKNPEEKAVVSEALGTYQQRLGEAAGRGFNPPKREYQGMLAQRIATAVAAAV